ncbi:MAG: hypothetical protein R3E02_09930 [Blastomonas sp.]
MTLPPSKIGDKGQRYEIRVFGWPLEDQWNVVGWAGNWPSARRMAKAFQKVPGVQGYEITDREAFGK